VAVASVVSFCYKGLSSHYTITGRQRTVRHGLGGNLFRLTFDDIQCQSCQRGLLVARLHVEAGLVHGGDHLVE